MTVHTTPIPARSDVTTSYAPATVPGIRAGLVRRLGAVLTAGAATWSVSLFIWGPNPGYSRDLVSNLTALAFQVGVLALLHVQLRTRATGLGKLARRFMYVEHVLLACAMVSSLIDAFHGAGTVPGMIFDPFWPLSMLGMAAIGVRIAIAGRWTGVARFWPVLAESWAVVTVPAFQASATLGQFVGATHMLLGYVVVGLILVLRPQLTGAR